MNKIAGCLVCLFTRYGLVYAAVGLTFGVASVIVAAFVAWPHVAVTFCVGIVSGAMALTIAPKILDRLPTFGRVIAELHPKR